MGTVSSLTQDTVTQRLRVTVTHGHIPVTASWGMSDMTFFCSVFPEICYISLEQRCAEGTSSRGFDMSWEAIKHLINKGSKHPASAQ